VRIYNLLSIIIGFLLILTGCVRQPEYHHNNLIYPKEDMVKLLKEIHLLEAELMAMNQDSMLKVKSVKYQEVFTKYDIDSAQFKSFMEYYLARPDLMAEVYEQVLDSLTVLQKSSEN
jgi:poly-beta-hydroxyalkanoate depolymerase